MPERTCLGCLAVKEKKGLVRLTVTGGVLMADPHGRLGRRGAYVCPAMECLKAALARKGAFARALRSKVDVPDIEVIWEAMRPLTGKKG